MNKLKVIDDINISKKLQKYTGNIGRRSRRNGFIWGSGNVK
jgi:hypothetical protein